MRNSHNNSIAVGMKHILLNVSFKALFAAIGFRILSLQLLEIDANNPAKSQWLDTLRVYPVNFRLY